MERVRPGLCLFEESMAPVLKACIDIVTELILFMPEQFFVCTYVLNGHIAGYV